MLTTVEVEVTQQMIDEGERGACAYCPVAKGLMAATNRRWLVAEGGTAASELTPGRNVCVQLPLSCRAFVSAFDRRQSVQPFSFPFTYDRVI